MSYEELKAEQAKRRTQTPTPTPRQHSRPAKQGGTNTRRPQQFASEELFQQVLNSSSLRNSEGQGFTQHDVSNLRNDSQAQDYSLFSAETFRMAEQTILMQGNERQQGGGTSGEPSGFEGVDPQTHVTPNHQPVKPKNTVPGPDTQRLPVQTEGIDLALIGRRFRELELQNQALRRELQEKQSFQQHPNQGGDSGDDDENNQPNHGLPTGNAQAQGVFVMSEISARDRGSPWKSLELALKGKIISKSLLTSDANTFESWKRYMKNIFDSSWMSCLSKINIYKIPDASTWKQWDYNCLHGITGNVPRITYQDIMTKTDQSEPVMSYLNQAGDEITFSTSTHVDIMNTALIALQRKYGGQLFYSVCSLLTNSIDVKSMKSVLNLTQVFDINNLRRTYVEALKFHENNSDSIIALRVSKFTSIENFKMVQNEPPLGFLRRLQEETDFINSMTPANEAPPITDRALRTKFLDMVKNVDYLQSAVRTYEIGYIDQYGQRRQHSLDTYAQLLQNVYQERKDKFSYSAKDHYHSNQRGYTVQETECVEDFGFALGESSEGNNPKHCYAFRDTGKCKFGKDCKYEHVKGKFPQKFPHKANFSNEALMQYMENVQHESAMQIKEFKKKFVHKFKKNQNKMLKYKQKLGERNSKGSKEKAAVAQESKEEKAAIATEEIPVDEAEDSSKDDESDLSALDSSSDDN